ncbi:MAG: formyltransferase family protein, partial [Ilumatobacteraceae bacterium]
MGTTGTRPKRLVVLVSGTGSNLQAILDACTGPSLPAEVVAVVSNRPDVFA